jgi:AraC-like DNA-binding protein
MTKGAKSMIAGCIDRMSADACGNCERRDACSELFGQLFRNREPRQRRAPPRGQGTFQNMFLNVLREVARNVERNVQARQAAAEAPAAIETPVRKPAAVPGPFQREVEAHLEPRLAAGPLGIDAVARELGYSRQTLYRRLKAEGVTFEEVLDGLRRRVALRLLCDDGLSVKEAAWRLGFSDPAAFSRAFKRWTGAAPTAARRDH